MKICARIRFKNEISKSKDTLLIAVMVSSKDVANLLPKDSLRFVIVPMLTESPNAGVILPTLALLFLFFSIWLILEVCK